ncbi:unnamed protein product [Meloidogyne enterolobii]
MFWSKIMSDHSIQPDWDGEYEFLKNVRINGIYDINIQVRLIRATHSRPTLLSYKYACV